MLQHHFSFSVCDIVRMIDNGFSAAFLDAPTKRRIRSDAMHDVFSILRAEGYDIDRILKELPGRYDAFWVEEEFNMKNGLPYWEGFTNPPITKEIVRLIPKADLNCRLGLLFLKLVFCSNFHIHFVLPLYLFVWFVI